MEFRNQASKGTDGCQSDKSPRKRAFSSASNVKRKAALIGGESWGHSFDPCLHVIFGYDDFPE
nr:MAG TPA: hypothetical protein [Caudoviricetes sp.]